MTIAHIVNDNGAELICTVELQCLPEVGQELEVAKRGQNVNHQIVGIRHLIQFTDEKREDIGDHYVMVIVRPIQSSTQRTENYFNALSKPGRHG